MSMRDEQRREAIKRLQILEDKGLCSDLLLEFKHEGRLHYSERMTVPPFGVNGIIFRLEDEPALAEAVQVFEQENNAIVYHATHETIGAFELLDLLFVSPDQDEWEMDRADLADNYCFGYCMNLTYSECSELGSFPIQVRGGGLIREF